MNAPSWVVPWQTQPSLISEKISITADWIKIYAPNFMGRWTTAMQRWSRDQKSKPEVNSRDVIKWICEDKCVDLSDYNRYLNQI